MSRSCELPRGILSRVLTGSFVFVSVAPLGLVCATLIGVQDLWIGIGIGIGIGIWFVVQFAAISTWNPDERTVVLGFYGCGYSRRVPEGVSVVVIPGSAYGGAPWNGVGYYPDEEGPVVNPMPVYLPGSGWLGERRRTRWVLEINESRETTAR